MIQVLGVKRVLTLAVLAAANIALGVMVYYVVIPGKTKTETELATVRSQISSRRTEVSTLQTQYQEIQEQKTLFGDLDKSGFFGSQDRLQARKTIEAIQAASHVLSAKYNINAVEVKQNPVAAESDHVLLQSPVSVKIDALDDMDIYSFIYWIENAFPGNSLITGLTIERKMDIDENVLKQIGNGLPAVLVSADLAFAWNTFVPRTQLPQQLGQPPAP